MKSFQRLAALVGLLLLLAPATLLAKKSAMTPHDVTRIQQVMDAAISPDGGSFAYVKWVQAEPFKDPDGSGWRELHVIRKDGKSRPYVHGKVKVRGVQWTPDGQGISFLTKRGDDQHSSLYVISLGGGEAEQVLTHSSGISSYQWHPSGKKVVFLARGSTSKAKKALAKRGFKAEVYEEELHNSQIWIAKIAKDADSPRKLALPGSVSAVHWSPDGKRLACAVAPTALIDDHYMKRRIVVLDAKSGKIKGRINNPGKLGSIYWRPDGKRIAFLAGGDLNDPSAQRLMIADAGGGPMQDLMPELKDGGVRGAAWLNNDKLLCLVDHGVETNLTVLGPKGEASILIKDGAGALSHLSVARKSGNFAVLSHTAAHAQELFSGNATKGELTRLTDSNPWLANRLMGKQEGIVYKAQDGLEIGGLLIHPIGKVSKKGAPLIVQVHGGPESHYRNGWVTSYSNLGQVAAGRGFAVFFPNYRGSTGRGVAYSKADHHDPAGKEFQDIVDGVNYLAEQKIIDKSRVGSMGGSYGGYASAWAATYYSKHYKAAAVFVGISDQISKIGTTDIANEMVTVHFRKKPWENWDFFLKRSPIYYAHQSTTATLILHGKADTRVDPGQSRELYRHLKIRGKGPVRLVLYPGEGHGNRMAAARLDYHLRTLRWMERFLKSSAKDAPDSDIDYKKELGSK